MGNSLSQPSRHVLCGFFALSIVSLSACENMGEGFTSGSSGDDETPSLAGTLNLEERDVEAPDVFNVTDEALWDGRPSFGGVWVAYPGNTQPERISIKNTRTGKTVVGALFKREGANPGPAIRMSSDAAEALGAEAGTPLELTIVALRREPVEVGSDEVIEAETQEAPEVLSETVLDPVDAGIAQIASDTETALASVPATPVITEVTPEPRKQPEAPVVAAVEAPAVAPAAPSDLSKPFIQVGTFSSEDNAKKLAARIAGTGVPSLARKTDTSSGKILYRVLAGPASSRAQFAEFQSKIVELGFKDTFPVSK